MIDNEQTEQIEELEDVVIDLAEDEGKQPEETSDTESPITAEAEEETDTKEANDQEETVDETPEEIKEESEEPEATEDDSKKVFGKRAEKRIKRLVAQKKELEEKLKAAEEEKHSLQAKTDQFARASAQNELDSINNYIEGLSSREEQALTALSLIFAVFLVNPSPICVLDEVDAPLDDANVTRFCSLLDELTKITQTKFIIITHHALTMSKMHRLYGITMPEKGISQLVAVDLQKAEDLVA